MLPNNLMILFIFLIAIIFFIFVISVWKQIKMHQLEVELELLKIPQQATTHETKMVKKNAKMSPEQFLLVLDWMVQRQIIDTKQYNQLIAKSLPFLE